MSLKYAMDGTNDSEKNFFVISDNDVSPRSFVYLISIDDPGSEIKVQKILFSSYKISEGK